ncbi:inactive leucine-rich repeat receptor-like protein kinase [Apostasia shenzhenica]|uniref:Inactive leucine-rich repeat receptor-like protein kinase n=1 Tax=Apostasia shenzhenica TaxID=1088818 RepID=A0A2I0A8J5_9ASPA|nr:inactive leucine-rich repeat receptor-like protein kinase [Apostasia shenzhenica]
MKAPLFLLFIPFFFLLLSGFSCSAGPDLNDDVLGLIVFKAGVQDPQSKLASWNEDDENSCGWAGVKCDRRTGLVVELTLDGLGLSGKIGRGLLQLRSLRTLSLSRNNFSGLLNPEITQLESLRTVDLSGNALSGPIALEFFGQCRSLRSVSLAGNRFSGQIPASVGDCLSLVSLNLSSNWLSGSLPLGIWSLYNLRNLDLSANFLAGEIPIGVNRLFNLREINLRRNRLSGRLPDDIGDCLLLRSLNLGENSFSGRLPETLQKLKLCSYLILGSNDLSGEVPTWLGEMQNLQSLDLSNNGFIGRVPDSIGSLRFLKTLNLSGNSLTGRFPESMADLTALTDLDFSKNSLVGSLPPWLFQFGLQKIILSRNNLNGSIKFSTASDQKIQILDLSANMIYGSIPLEIGDLQSLQFLNLSHNSFTSSIPETFGRLESLQLIDLENNSLTGRIPIQIGKCSSLTFLILSNNNLSGPIPPNLVNLTSLQMIDLSHNNLTGELPKRLSELPHLISFNISHNLFSGEIPTGNFFDHIPPSSLSENPSLCGSAINLSCHTVLPKPIVLNPNSSSSHSPQNSSVYPVNFNHKKIILSLSTLIAIGAAIIITVGVITIAVLNRCVRAPASRSAVALNISDGYFSQSPATDSNSGKLFIFSGGNAEFSTGAHTILNKDCELGRGGFGTVYKTVLSGGRLVAIKKLTVSSLVKSQEDFEREIKKIGKMKHPNLVALEGYYWTHSLQLLIYEFVPSGSLFKHLHESSESNSLSWQERFDIVIGVARSLAHLHQHKVIHYNLKSSNVLLDATGDPKVADYGLAKLLPKLDRYVLSSKIQSALGYMAPEFVCHTVKITEKCDVYGFGVLALEVLTGRKPVEYMEDDVLVLCDVIRGALDDGIVEDFMDVRLGGKFPVEEAVSIVKLALICTSQVPSNRPDMTDVVKILELIRCPGGSQGEELS